MRKQEHVEQTKQILIWMLETFEGGEWKLATAFGNEGMVLLDLLSQLTERPRVFTIDTGRLPEATYELMTRVQERYDMDFEVYFPEAARVEEMVRENGINLFYQGAEQRKLCCHVRKVEPLRRALSGVKIWLSGLRKEQSKFRADRRQFELDGEGRIKAYPLLEWSSAQVWDYLYRHQVPYNALYDQGYTSIGCAPCSRPVTDAQDQRAGRWWWETESKKECGIHG